MRKLFAISMLIVYLVNLTGYRFFYNYYIDLSDKQIVQQVDKTVYDDSALKEIKLKLNLPYVTGSPVYERFDGAIELAGVSYNYVKRKVFQDTLYLLCLPNETKTTLLKQKADYAQTANDLPAGKDGKPSVKKTQLLAEYKQRTTVYDFAVIQKTLPQEVSYSPASITNPFITTIGHPPEIHS